MKGYDDHDGDDDNDEDEGDDNVGDEEEQGSSDGAVVSSRLPPMWPGFDSRTRRHMWVEFVVSSCPSAPRVFLRVLRFSSLLKN